MVYDITSSKSFESLGSWKDEFLSQSNAKDAEHFPFVVLGNKVDKEDERKVPNARAAQWCRDSGNIPFFETSAKDAVNVDEAFLTIARNALSQIKLETSEYKPPIDLSKKPKKKDKAACC